MIADSRPRFRDRDELIEYLTQSAAVTASSVGFRSEEEMFELAELGGCSYIGRRTHNVDEIDDLDDDELGEDACSVPIAPPKADVPPIADDHKHDAAKTDSAPEHDLQTTKDSLASDKSKTVDPVTELQELVARAKFGDEEALVKIRTRLNDNPAIWQAVGDLAAHAETLLINIIADGNAMVSESMDREIKRLKDELADGVTPTPLERLTIQRIVACWMMCQYVDRAALAADAAGAKAACWGKRQESAERRYQAAIKSLDLVRRLKPRKKAATKAEVTSVADGRKSLAGKSGKPKARIRKTTKPVKQKKKGNLGSAKAGHSPSNRIQKFVREKVPVQ